MNFLLGWVIVILLPTLFNKDVITQTDNPMPTFQTNNENDYEANEVKKGIDWLQNWYATRKDMKSPDGRPFLTDAEYRNIEHTLKNLKVTLTNDIKRIYVSRYRTELSSLKVQRLNIRQL